MINTKAVTRNRAGSTEEPLVTGRKHWMLCEKIQNYGPEHNAQRPSHSITAKASRRTEQVCLSWTFLWRCLPLCWRQSSRFSLVTPMKPTGHIGALTFGTSLDELDVERHSFLISITDVDRTVIWLEMSWKFCCRNKIAATATQGSMITIIKNNQNRSMAQNRKQTTNQC